ncbi:MAG: hypothetical protein IKP01_02230 [Bacteroidales bacterium]|nr:hypothetical protein [Bacteroidales bacterium]
MAGISLGAANALESAIDAKIASAARRRTRTSATVTRVDVDGTVYAVLDGGDVETPVSRAASSVKPGDVVGATVQDGMLSIDGNYTEPSAGVSRVSKVEQVAEAAVDGAARAQQAAASAEYDAARARDAADSAGTAASNAQSSADHANAYATSALDQLGIVQDVVGVLDWASKHGTFAATADTTVQDGTVYFAYDSQTGDYTPVVEPASNPSAAGYYVLTMSEAMNDFILAHLAVTTRGLWVLPSGVASTDQTVDNDVDKASSSDTSAQKQANANARKGNDCKLLLSNDGTYIYDGSGYLKADYSDVITLYGGSNASGAYPKVEISSNAAKLYQSANNHADVTSGGMEVYQGGTSVANFGQTARIGYLEWNTSATFFEPNGMILRAGIPVTADLAGILADAGLVIQDFEDITFASDWTHELDFTPAIGSEIKVYNHAGTAGYGLAATFIAGTAEDVVVSSRYVISYDGDKTISYDKTGIFYISTTGVRFEYSKYYGTMYPTLFVGNFNREYFRASNTASVGVDLIAMTENQVVSGTYNEADEDNKYAVIVGNGTADDARSNAFTVGWDGSVEAAGSVTALEPELGYDADSSGFIVQDPSNFPTSQGAAPSANVYGDIVAMRQDDFDRARLAAHALTDGRQGVVLEAARYDSSDNRVANTLAMWVAADGTRTVGLSDANAWLSALGLTVTHTDTASNILSASSGITIQEAHLTRFGSIAMLSVKFKRSTAIGSGDITNINVATLKSGIHPRHYATLSGFSAGIIQGYITSGGVITLATTGGSIAANAEIWVGSTYIIG